MTLIDTSARIEYLRDSGSRACQLVDGLVVAGLITTSPVRMELLAGACSAAHLDQLRRLLGRGGLASVVETDYEHGAAIFRACRHGGETIRRMFDCLIAAVALREAVPVLHADGDFEVIARHIALQLAS